MAAIWAIYGSPFGILAGAIACVLLLALIRAGLDSFALLLALIPTAALPMTGLVSPGTQYVPTATLGAVLLVLTARELPSHGRRGLPPRIVLGSVAGFVMWSVVAAATSPWRTTGAIYVVGIAAILAVCFLVAPAAAVRRKYARRAVLEVIAGCGVIVAAFDVVLFLIGPAAPFGRPIGRFLMMEVTLGGSRTGLVLPWATGPFLSPASASAILVTALLASLALDRGWVTARASGPIVARTTFIAGALMLTWTRTGWLAACGGLAVLALEGWWSTRRRPQTVAWLGAFVLLTSGVIVGYLGADLRTDIDFQRYASVDVIRGLPTPSATLPASPSMATPGPGATPGATSSIGGIGDLPDQLPEIRGGSNLNGRLALWEASISAVRGRPITGWGPGTNPQAIGPFLGTQGADYGGLTSHSTWLRTAVETGIPGFLFVAGYVLAVLGIAGRALARRRASHDPIVVGMLAIFVGLLVWQTFESSTLGGLTYPAFLWGLTGALLTSAIASVGRPAHQPEHSE